MHNIVYDNKNWYYRKQNALETSRHLAVEATEQLFPRQLRPQTIYCCNHICLVKDSTSGFPVELHNFAFRRKSQDYAYCKWTYQINHILYHIYFISQIPQVPQNVFQYHFLNKFEYQYLSQQSKACGI